MLVGAIIAILGLFSAIFGIINLNSLEAQLSSAFSGSTNPGYIWLAVGAVAIIIGVIVMFKSKKNEK